MKWWMACIFGACVGLIYSYGPEWLRYHNWRVYDQIQSIKYRLEILESK